MKPMLLLIPGMLNPPEVWAEVAARLADMADVRLADVRTQASIAEMARDAWATVAERAAGVPLVVCGFSMGGYVAQEMLATAPARISAVALLGTSSRPESDEGVVVREKTIAAIGRDFAKVVDGVARFGTHPARHDDAAFMERLRTLLASVGPDVAIRQNRAILARADHRPALAHLALPALVMCGREDRITPPVLSEELATQIPGAQLEWIDDAGHMSPLEQPARVADLLAGWLPRATHRPGEAS